MIKYNNYYRHGRSGGEKGTTMFTESERGELRERILNDRHNGLVFSAGQRLPLYLVGGYLRDLLIGRDSLDRDYVAGGDIESLLEQIVAETGGKVIRLGNYLRRIVLKDNSTLDFSPLINNIADDLSRRDFTMNSLAWSPGTGIVDPHGGVKHLRQRRISIISRDSIEHDPVRMIRAYRFAGELSFRIDRPTRRIIRELSGRISEAKSERITLEFFKILNLKDPSTILAMMANDGFLNQIFLCGEEELSSKLRVLSRVNRILNALPLKYKGLLGQIYSQNLSREGVIRLEVLMSGLPAKALSLSSKIIGRVEDIKKGERILRGRSVSRAGLFEAFSLMGDASIDFLIVKGRTTLLPDYASFRTIMKKSLLSTEEIIVISGLAKGVNLGKAILSLKKAEFSHTIKTRSEAVNLLKKYSSDGI
jgi:hypothetical protein